MCYTVSDAMRRESAIADDFWDEIFVRNVNDRMEVALKNIEQKYEQSFLKIFLSKIYFYRIDHLTPSEQEDNQPIVVYFSFLYSIVFHDCFMFIIDQSTATKETDERRK
jgi:hypothetical protein